MESTGDEFRVESASIPGRHALPIRGSRPVETNPAEPPLCESQKEEPLSGVHVRAGVGGEGRGGE